MKRERYNPVENVENAFWTPTLVAQSTTHHLEARNLNVTIMHSFGIATSNVINNFFGLDNVQNVRIGLDYGITDRWEIGIGRSSLLNVIDIRSKYAIFHQKSDNSVPLSLSIKGDLGIVSQENQKPFKDDVSTLVSAVVSRKFNKTFSLQLSPMYAHFNDVNAEEENNLYAVGIGSQIHLSERYSFIVEYYPLLGSRNNKTKNSFSMGIDIQTGGHVFQLFFTSTYWHLEQYIIAQNDKQFWAGDFRFGFNINRVFGL
ncbi:MAG: DUF5777 family beta-barrel protein [Balneolaceae bacterium]